MIQGKNNEQIKPFYLVKNKKMSFDFPDVSDSLKDPNGLLAIGGDLSEKKLLSAYKKGIFPWFNDGQPILWWSPDPRCVLKPNEIHISHSLKKCLRKKQFKITFNQVFTSVINECSINRDNNDTWLTKDMKIAFTHLHELGYAHSIEYWQNGKLTGGLYGIAMGKIFFGESMFSSESDASKIALVYLARKLEDMEFKLIDCQVNSPHIQTLGAKLIAREKFTTILDKHCNYDKTLFA